MCMCHSAASTSHTYMRIHCMHACIHTIRTYIQNIHTHLHITCACVFLGRMSQNLTSCSVCVCMYVCIFSKCVYVYACICSVCTYGHVCICVHMHFIAGTDLCANICKKQNTLTREFTKTIIAGTDLCAHIYKQKNKKTKKHTHSRGNLPRLLLQVQTCAHTNTETHTHTCTHTHTLTHAGVF